MMKEYPAKKRGVAVGKPYPGRSRDVEVGGPYPKGPPTRSASDNGKKPKKGVLSRGGGHG